MTWFFPSTLIWYHTHKYIADTWANKLTYSYKYILPPPVMCSQQLSVLNWTNNLLISTFYRLSMSLLFQNYWFVEVIYLLIRFNKAKFFPWNMKNIKRLNNPSLFMGKTWTSPSPFFLEKYKNSNPVFKG